MITYEAQLWYRMPDTKLGYEMAGSYTPVIVAVGFTNLKNPPQITQVGDIITIYVSSETLVLHQDSFIGCTFHPEQKENDADN